MKKLIIATSALVLAGLSTPSFAAIEKCNQVFKDSDVILRPGKVVVKFTYPGNLAGPPTGKIWYRGDLNGATETLRVKTFINGSNLGTYHLQGGTDASPDNNAPGSTYDPNLLYTESSTLPGGPGTNMKLVFRLNNGDDASWAVVKKIKLFMNCNMPYVNGG